MFTRVWPGSPYPLGATWDGSGVNFALFSGNATQVELCLFDSAEARAESAHHPTAHEMEAFERVLTVLEEKLYSALTAAAPEDLLVALKEHAARELAPYRSRMGAVQMRQVEHQFVQKQMLVHYNLPRLSLFYMSQQ